MVDSPVKEPALSLNPLDSKNHKPLKTCLGEDRGGRRRGEVADTGTAFQHVGDSISVSREHNIVTKPGSLMFGRVLLPTPPTLAFFSLVLMARYLRQTSQNRCSLATWC